MQKNRLSESKNVAKIQKTFYLNEQLAKLVEGISTNTGASFTKIVTAALIKHLLGDLCPSNAQWMRLAVGLERGDITVPEILLQIADEVAAKKEKAYKEFNEESWIAKTTKGKYNVGVEHGWYKTRREQLHDKLENNPDALDWIIKNWSSYSSGNKNLDDASVLKELESQD